MQHQISTRPATASNRPAGAARRRIGIALALAAIAALAPLPVAATAQERVAPAGPVEVLTLKELRALDLDGGDQRRSHPLRTLGPAESGAAAPSGARSSDSQSQPQPRATVFNGLNEPGLDANPSGSVPPDTTGAIGPQHYIEFTNEEIGVYDRDDLSLLASTTIDSFVRPAGGANAFDPQIQWDPAANRWFYVTDDTGGGNFVDFGWSKTADPTDLGTGGWCRFTIGTGTKLDDYPKLGRSPNHIVIGVNRFDLGTSAFETSIIYALAKPANGDASCTPPTGSAFGSAASPLRTSDNNIAFTPVPANAAEGASGGFVVAADTPYDGPNRTQIMTWQVGGPPTAPTLTALGNTNVAAFNFPNAVPQPGIGTDTLDALDARLTQAVSAVDPVVGEETVWTQHTIEGAGGRSAVRWYQLRPATLTARQQGTISDPSHYVFNAAVSPSTDGSGAAIAYNVGSASLSPELRASSRDGSLALGQMSGQITLGSSVSPVQDFSCNSPPGSSPSCRWGDYAGASPDPVNETLVWGSNQLSGAANGVNPAWITRNFALQTDITPPSTQITSGPSGPTNQTSPSFGFTASEPATFQCQVDSSAFTACSSPRTVGPLADGPHVFRVRATDLAGNVGTTASRSFSVDTTVAGADVSAKDPQKQNRKKKRVKVKVSAGAAEAITALGTGTVKAGKKSFDLKPATKPVAAGEQARLKLKAPKRAAKKIIKALKRGKKASAKISVELTDDLGNSTTKKLSVGLE